jgi:hypothetical protein
MRYASASASAAANFGRERSEESANTLFGGISPSRWFVNVLSSASGMGYSQSVSRRLERRSGDGRIFLFRLSESSKPFAAFLLDDFSTFRISDDHFIHQLGEDFVDPPVIFR